MNETALNRIAESFGIDKEYLVDAFCEFTTVEKLKDSATDIFAALSGSVDKYENLEAEIAIKAYHNVTICTLSIDEADLSAIALAYVLAKNAHEQQMTTSGDDLRPEYKAYIEYLIQLEEVNGDGDEFERAKHFLGNYIGFAHEPAQILIKATEIVINS